MATELGGIKGFKTSLEVTFLIFGGAIATHGRTRVKTTNYNKQTFEPDLEDLRKFWKIAEYDNTLPPMVIN